MMRESDPEGRLPLRPLAGEALLEAWERGSAEPQPARAVTLLRAGCPELSEADAFSMPIAGRDRVLADLRRRSFGRTLVGFAECPACRERLEFTLPTDAIAAAANAAD